MSKLMTEQEAFDISLGGIRKQGRRSVDDAGMCQYRGKDGLKCAMGQFISDEDYKPDFEHKDASTLIDYLSGDNVPSIERVRHLHVFLDRMQGAHDYALGTAWADQHSHLHGVMKAQELSKLSIGQQEALVEEAFELLAKDRNLKYECKPWNKTNNQGSDAMSVDQEQAQLEELRLRSLERTAKLRKFVEEHVSKHGLPPELRKVEKAMRLARAHFSDGHLKGVAAIIGALYDVDRDLLELPADPMLTVELPDTPEWAGAAIFLNSGTSGYNAGIVFIGGAGDGVMMQFSSVGTPITGSGRPYRVKRKDGPRWSVATDKQIEDEFDRLHTLRQRRNESLELLLNPSKAPASSASAAEQQESGSYVGSGQDQKPPSHVGGWSRSDDDM